MKDNKLKIRLAFSGGGFRATFYCLGAARRLAELGLWDKVCSISSVSGGSITAGAIMAGLSEGRFKDVNDFDKKVTDPLIRLGQSRLREKITWPVYILLAAFTGLYLGVIVLVINNILLGLFSAEFFQYFLMADIVIYFLIIYFFIKPTVFFSSLFRSFLSLFFKRRKIQSLPEYPEWSANATCLNTGKRFRFKQKNFGGYNIGITEDNEDISVAFAVACSAAFPPVFAPFKLGLKGRKFTYRKYDKPLKGQGRVLLTDGGVYDNLGSEPILQIDDHSNQKSGKSEDRFIVLDAGDYISSWSSEGHWFGNTGRIIAAALDQIICLRRRLIYHETCTGTQGIMLILGCPVEEYLTVTDNKFGKLGDKAMPVSQYKKSLEEAKIKAIEEYLPDMRTDLDGFHDVEIAALMWAGAVRMDIAVKRCLSEYVSQDSEKDIPALPPYSAERIREVLMKGRRESTFVTLRGFLHRSLREKTK